MTPGVCGDHEVSAAKSPVIRGAERRDEPAWRRMFVDYARGAGITLAGRDLERVWRWILTVAAQTNCLVAEADDGLLGFAHYRVFERPILADTGLYVDDLYVVPAARGAGVATALIAALRRQAKRDGHSVVRWTTRQDNLGAQRIYDRIATRAPVHVYNADPVSR